MAAYTYNGCVYEVRRETIKDALKADSIARLFPGETSWELARAFVRWALLTTTDKGEFVLGKPITALTAAELVAAADAWGDNDPDAVYLFYDAAQRAKETPNAEHLKPGVEPGN